MAIMIQKKQSQGIDPAIISLLNLMQHEKEFETARGGPNPTLTQSNETSSVNQQMLEQKKLDDKAPQRIAFNEYQDQLLDMTNPTFKADREVLLKKHNVDIGEYKNLKNNYGEDTIRRQVENSRKKAFEDLKNVDPNTAGIIKEYLKTEMSKEVSEIKKQRDNRLKEMDNGIKNFIAENADPLKATAPGYKYFMQTRGQEIKQGFDRAAALDQQLKRYENVKLGDISKQDFVKMQKEKAVIQMEHIKSAQDLSIDDKNKAIIEIANKANMDLQGADVFYHGSGQTNPLNPALYMLEQPKVVGTNQGKEQDFSAVDKKNKNIQFPFSSSGKIGSDAYYKDMAIAWANKYNRDPREFNPANFNEGKFTTGTSSDRVTEMKELQQKLIKTGALGNVLDKEVVKEVLDRGFKIQQIPMIDPKTDKVISNFTIVEAGGNPYEYQDQLKRERTAGADVLARMGGKNKLNKYIGTPKP